jgi:hypothetical protein
VHTLRFRCVSLISDNVLYHIWADRGIPQPAEHTSLAMTQRYIEGYTEAKRKLIALI